MMKLLSSRRIVTPGHLKMVLVVLAFFGNEAVAQVETFFKVDPRGMYLQPFSFDNPSPASSLDLASNGIGAGDILDIKNVGDFDAFSPGTPGGGDKFTGAIGVFFAGTVPVLPGTGSTANFTNTATPCGDSLYSSDIPQDFDVPPNWVRLVVPAGATSLKFATRDCYVSDNSDANDNFGILWRSVKLDQLLLLNPLAKALASGNSTYSVDPAAATDAPSATKYSADGRSAVVIAVKHTPSR